MRPADEVVEQILEKFREKKVAQVPGYYRFGYLRETASAVYVSRETGKDTPIPFAKLAEGILAVRRDPNAYETLGRLKDAGITRINSPIWALLHLVSKTEILK